MATCRRALRCEELCIGPIAGARVSRVPRKKGLKANYKYAISISPFPPQ